MSRTAPPELEQAVKARNGRQEGCEIRFQCPFPGNHSNGDADPSARYNPAKGVWVCDTCGEGGGWTGLWQQLGLPRIERSPSPIREIVATYSYRDIEGKLLFEVVRRTNPKGFSQRRPDGAGGWLWKLNGTPRVLYRLPEIAAAIQEGRTIYLVEGEKDADNLARLGLAATTNPGGAGKWQASYSESLRSAKVVILPDNDTPGRDHAQSVAKALQEIAAEVRILVLSDLPEKGDISDWIDRLEQGGGKDTENVRAEIERLALQAPYWTPDQRDGARESKEKQPAQAQILMELAAEADLFRTPDGSSYATVAVNDHLETWALRSRAFRGWLMRQFYEETGRPPGAQALRDVLALLDAKAQFEAGERSVSIRSAGDDNAIYLQLGNSKWEVLEITAKGWSIAPKAPVRYCRPRGLGQLPCPEAGGTVEELSQLVNLGDRRSLVLVVAWLLAALRPTGPYPILILQGEQGSAKSTAARVLRSLIDPSAAPLRTMPRDERDLMIGATNSWVIALDNLSDLPGWLSDALCRLATGGGFSTRELYSDAEEILFDAQRPVLLNGIEDLTGRQDLTDRAIIVHLPVIPEEKRRTERELLRQVEAARPRILGALCTAVSTALGNIYQVRLPVLPRMADFAEWVVAAEPVLPWAAGTFLEAYTGNREDAVGLALEADLVATAICELISASETWEGTATDLLVALEAHVPERSRKSRSWPGSAKGLSGRLRRAATFLRMAGIEVEFYRQPGCGSRRMIAIRKIGACCVATVATVAGEVEVIGDPEIEDATQRATHGATQIANEEPHRVGLSDAGDECDATESAPLEGEDV